MIIFFPCTSVYFLFCIANDGQDLFPIICGHVSDLLWLVQSHYSRVLQIHLLNFSLLGQDHSAFNCWGFLRRQQYVCQSKLGRMEVLDLLLIGEGPNQGLKKELSLQVLSRKVQKQGEKGRAKAESCRNWKAFDK